MYLLKVERQVLPRSFGFSTVYGVFQGEGPLIHLLLYRMYEPLKLQMGRFLKSQVLKDIEGKHLQKSDNLPSNSQIERVKILVLPCLSWPLTNQSLRFGLLSQVWNSSMWRLQSIWLTIYQIIDKKLVRDVFFLHPFLRDSEHGAQVIWRLAIMMPMSEEEVELITHGLCTRPELLTEIVQNKE